jgi:hypothetical protein
MLNDLDAAIAISSNIARSKLSVKANIDIILLDTDWIQISKQESENLDVVVERTTSLMFYTLRLNRYT